MKTEKKIGAFDRQLHLTYTLEYSTKDQFGNILGTGESTIAVVIERRVSQEQLVKILDVIEASPNAYPSK